MPTVRPIPVRSRPSRPRAALAFARTVPSFPHQRNRTSRSPSPSTCRTTSAASTDAILSELESSLPEHSPIRPNDCYRPDRRSGPTPLELVRLDLVVLAVIRRVGELLELLVRAELVPLDLFALVGVVGELVALFRHGGLLIRN